MTIAAAEDADAANGTATITVSSAGLTQRGRDGQRGGQRHAGAGGLDGHVAVNEGGTNTFTVRLAAQPAGDVTVTVARTAGRRGPDGQRRRSLTFTSGNWNTPQTVTSAAAEDADAVNGTATITVSSAGLTS